MLCGGRVNGVVSRLCWALQSIVNAQGIRSPLYSLSCRYGVKLLQYLKLYCRYLYTWPCLINHIWGLKQLWLQVNGHAWFHLQRLRWPVRNGEGAKIQNENICLQRDSNPHPVSPRQESCSALDRSATLVRYQVEHYSLTVFWNGYVTIPVWNRLWFDTQCKVLKTIIILAKIYNEIRNESLVWHSVQIHV